MTDLDEVGTFRLDKIKPVLKSLKNPYKPGFDTWSKSAEELVLATIIHESGGLQHREQVGGGPAVGLCQMEPPTFYDHINMMSQWGHGWEALQQSVMRYSETNLTDHEELKESDELSVAMCRVHYLREPGDLPQANDIYGMAEYWFDHYNKGAEPTRPSKTSNFVEDYHHFVMGDKNEN